MKLTRDQLVAATFAADAQIADFGFRADSSDATQGRTSFLGVMNFLASNPDKGASLRVAFGTPRFFEKAAQRYFKGRFRHELPSEPTTIPDDMVKYILTVAFSYPAKDIEYLSKAHQHAMSAENAVGDLLERYLASILEPLGWVWCAGTLVTATDFLKLNSKSGDWVVLQIKNRDNSENSSSAGYRNAKEVRSWFRTFSKTGETNWPAFPLLKDESRNLLSEAGFKAFVRDFYKPLLKSKS